MKHHFKPLLVGLLAILHLFAVACENGDSSSPTQPISVEEDLRTQVYSIDSAHYVYYVIFRYNDVDEIGTRDKDTGSTNSTTGHKIGSYAIFGSNIRIDLFDAGDSDGTYTGTILNNRIIGIDKIKYDGKYGENYPLD